MASPRSQHLSSPGLMTPRPMYLYLTELVPKGPGHNQSEKKEFLGSQEVSGGSARGS